MEIDTVQFMDLLLEQSTFVLVGGVSDTRVSVILSDLLLSIEQSPEFNEADIVWQCPESDKWKVEEVEAMLAISQRAPYGERRVIFIERFDQMAGGGFDRLLLRLEQTEFSTMFVGACDQLRDVPATIRGRAQHVLQEPVGVSEAAKAVAAETALPEKEVRFFESDINQEIPNHLIARILSEPSAAFVEDTVATCEEYLEFFDDKAGMAARRRILTQRLFLIWRERISYTSSSKSSEREAVQELSRCLDAVRLYVNPTGLLVHGADIYARSSERI